MIRQINDVVLFVQDLDKCTAFYRDLLGLKATMSDDVSIAFQFEGSRHLVLLKVAAAEGMVTKEAISLDKGAAHQVLLCAGVEDIDVEYKALMAKGVEFIKPPISQPWGRRTAYFADPEGNLWELWQNI